MILRDLTLSLLASAPEQFLVMSLYPVCLTSGGSPSGLLDLYSDRKFHYMIIRDPDELLPFAVLPSGVVLTDLGLL